MKYKSIKDFASQNFFHFNAASLCDAAQAYEDHIARGDKMMITLAGAMSTARLGVSLAEMIRQDKVHILSVTGANLEEDVMHLIAHRHYKRVPEYRHLSAQEELQLFQDGYNRVTDTCIPEGEAFRRLEGFLLEVWQQAQSEQKAYLPHEYLYQILRSKKLEAFYQIDPKDSWVLAAAEKNLPIIVPGWEDSTTGNIFASYVLKGVLPSTTVKSGIDYMTFLARWYQEETKDCSVGFFQVGGGIAGDFPICVVPMRLQDMELKDTAMWAYFCQVSDATTSYGSYSGAVPNEKITWGKLTPQTPRFIIESDATIVVPLIFAWLLGW